ncbi:hypothetical protein DNHGIG_25370 [Collibacillus ludicampi]|uniref:Uncharacterized protein n=1 Tax=Collibacillus ludicampi TaxID=2771369 RepID=A0AAV4LGT9_9BACL|nr:hypothetical protein [Collibacillus ludicampi]GIM46988.1 hypothetical protein DNHGIG_25370 [Collibacillus ludicampi]
MKIKYRITHLIVNTMDHSSQIRIGAQEHQEKKKEEHIKEGKKKRRTSF